jgi:hypothetical protein
MGQQFMGDVGEADASHPTNDALPALRRILFAVLLTGFIVTGTDLILLAHFEDRLQLTPLILLGLGIVVLCWHEIHRALASVRVLQALMVFFVIGGLLGFVLHYRGSMEFQLEVNPDLSGLELFLKTIRAKAPPALGPSAMIFLGLLGLAYAFRYPVIRFRGDTKTTEGA